MEARSGRVLARGGNGCAEMQVIISPKRSDKELVSIQLEHCCNYSPGIGTQYLIR